MFAIYAAEVSLTANLPVLVTIHGGGFQEGSGNLLGPDFLLNQADIVMVN